MIPLALLTKEYDPITLNPLGWWSAEDALFDIGTSTPATIGQTVMRLPDRSGNGNHLDQTSGNLQPILYYLNGVDSTNGVAVSADGSNDRMGTAAFTVSSNRTVIMTLSIESGGLISQFGDKWDVVNGGFLIGTSSSEAITMQRGSVNVLTKGPVSGNLVNGKGPLVIIAQYANNKANIKTWINHKTVPLTAGAGADGSDLSSAVTFHIFGRPLENLPSKGYIAEVMVCNGHLTAQQRWAITDYQLRKYSLYA